jgi:L-2-hydroxyglutarate oxidase LhgO
MEELDVVIIGAGIVGLAVAARLSRRYGDVLILEKESAFGRHGSSRNSEVIHSGIYYPPGSLKASLCLKANRMMYQYLQDHDIGFRRCGKLVVAAAERDLEPLEKLRDNGLANGVEGLELMDGDRVRKMEPQVRCLRALWVPSTGILDSHGVMRALLAEARDNGAMAAFNCEVDEIRPVPGGYRIGLAGQDYRIKARIVVNCAGLWCDRVAELAGIDPQEAGYRLHWNKGEYYNTSRYRDMSHLIYPLPHPQGEALGIHTVLNLNGEVSFGPDSRYVDSLDYGVGEENKDLFLKSIRAYMDVGENDIWPSMAGIRPKLQEPGGEEKDFIIANERDRGLPDLINLVGIESPGLTCALGLAEVVESLLDGPYSPSDSRVLR